MSPKPNATAPLVLEDVAKSFTMHLQGGIMLPVVANVSFAAEAGQCVVLGGPSGIGKSSILKMIYGNYRCEAGRIWVRDGARVIDVASAQPREILSLRQRSIGYVSQFLRVIPRVSARDVVAACVRDADGGKAPGEAARARAETLLARLNLPSSLWDLPPATFSGGEQQRVNIACGFAGSHAILLMDEPTASLDAANRTVVMDMLNERKAAGAAIVGIFHDREVRDAVGDVTIDVTRFRPHAGASAPGAQAGAAPH